MHLERDRKRVVGGEVLGAHLVDERLSFNHEGFLDMAPSTTLELDALHESEQDATYHRLHGRMTLNTRRR